jgi:hypothetical protein
MTSRMTAVGFNDVERSPGGGCQRDIAIAALPGCSTGYQQLMQPTNVVLHAHAGSAWFDAQVGVYLVYATAAGHGVIDREL